MKWSLNVKIVFILKWCCCPHFVTSPNLRTALKSKQHWTKQTRGSFEIFATPDFENDRKTYTTGTARVDKPTLCRHQRIGIRDISNFQSRAPWQISVSFTEKHSDVASRISCSTNRMPRRNEQTSPLAPIAVFRYRADQAVTDNMVDVITDDELASRAPFGSKIHLKLAARLYASRAQTYHGHSWYCVHRTLLLCI